MRIVFKIPSAPPAKLISRLQDTHLTDPTFKQRLVDAMYAYFTALEQPQTAMLPRNLVRKTIHQCVAELDKSRSESPRLDKKSTFILGCYRCVWGILQREWKARLMHAVGSTRIDSTIPVDSKPWIEISEG